MLNKTGNAIAQWAAPRRENLLWLTFVLLTLPHFNPGFINGYATQWEPLINGWRVISALVILVWLLLIKRRVSLIVLAIGVQQGYILLNTLVHHGDAKNWFLRAISIMAVVMLYDLMQDERRAFLSSQMFCFELMIYTNLLTVLLYPSSMYDMQEKDSLFVYSKNHFLGYYNQYTIFAIPALLIAFLYMKERKKRGRGLALTFSVYMTALLLKSGGVIASMGCILLAYLLLRNFTSILNYYTSWITQFLFFVFIIVLKLQDYFRWLIDGILHKWNSLMGRADVWSKSIGLISKAWLFGYGHQKPIVRETELGYPWANSAHNLLLELFYKGGLINFLLFVGIVALAGYCVYRHRNTEESKLITVAFLGWAVSVFVEVFMQPFEMAMFVIAYYSNRDDLQPGEKDPLDIPKWDEWLRAVPGRLRARFARR